MKCLLAVIHNDSFPVAVRCNNGHPATCGRMVLSFLKYEFDEPRFRRNLPLLTPVSDSDVFKGDLVVGRWLNYDVLAFIQSIRQPHKIPNDIEFSSHDDCAWAYVVDLGRRSFDVFARGAGGTTGIGKLGLVASFNMGNLPSVLDFLQATGQQ